MHNAPPVVYPLGRSRFQAGVLLLCWLAGVAALVAWWLATPQLDGPLWLGLAAVLASGGVALRGWRNSPAGQLSWDGQTWRWQGHDDKEPVATRGLMAALDLQQVLLLKLDIREHAVLWLWAGRAAMPERWLDFRRAVYSPRKATPVPLPVDSPTP